MSRILSYSALTFALLSISACSFMTSSAKEAALSVTGRSGSETFNLTGELPPDFGVEATAWYTPIKPSASCETDNFYSSEKRTRYHAEAYEKAFEGHAHAFSFKVPLTYSVGLCDMAITSIDMRIEGRYGDRDWQQTYDDGGLRFVDALPVDSPYFNEAGVLKIVGKCEWLFRDMPARNELTKLLNCRGAGAYLQADKIANKTVIFKIKVSSMEKPLVRNRWIKGDSGWKPCLGTHKSGRCQIPPKFKTFQMNGETCTVYPSCKEQ